MQRTILFATANRIKTQKQWQIGSMEAAVECNRNGRYIIRCSSSRYEIVVTEMATAVDLPFCDGARSSTESAGDNYWSAVTTDYNNDQLQTSPLGKGRESTERLKAGHQISFAAVNTL